MRSAKQSRSVAAAVAAVVAVVVGIAGCSTGGSDPAARRSTTTGAPAVTTARSPEAPETTEPSAGSPAGSIDPSLTRDDVACDDEALGSDDQISFVDAAYVVDRALGALCFGTGTDTLTTAWTQLAAITPPDRLTDLALFAGFAADAGEAEESDGTTLAFVNTIDDAGTVFQMSVNLEAFEEDPDEAMLTMAHEFSHVFTATPDQIDRAEGSEDECPTYFNGEGCYLPGGLMADWIDTFWKPEDLAAIDPDAEVGVDDGDGLCRVDPSFLGPYAATTPEEDFAESFSAFVFRVPAPTDEVQAKLDWFAQHPDLVEFQQRAADAGMGPLEGSFEGCGS